MFKCTKYTKWIPLHIYNECVTNYQYLLMGSRNISTNNIKFQSIKINDVHSSELSNTYNYLDFEIQFKKLLSLTS